MKTVDPLGNETIFTYDEVGNRTGITDAESKTTRYEYDAVGRLVKVIDVNSSITTYQYDVRGNRVSFADAKGNTTTYEYDKRNRLTKETDPLGKTVRYEYDVVGNLNKKVDGNNATIQYQYDNVNQLVTQLYPDGSRAAYEYNAVSNRTRMYNQNIDTQYTYDSMNRLTTVVARFIGPNLTKTLAHSYDRVGNRTAITYPEGETTKYYYNALNQVIKIEDSQADTIIYEYNKIGNRTKIVYPNGVTSTYKYNSSNWLTNIGHDNGKNPNSSAVIPSFDYTYNWAGMRTAVETTGWQSGKTEYTYDNLYQLTGVKFPDGKTQKYVYDTAGNRVSFTDSQGTVSYSYNQANELLTAGNVSFTYDGNGNQISKSQNHQITQYNYDYENRLNKVTLPNGQGEEYQYNPVGKRISVTTLTANSSRFTTYFVYDALRCNNVYEFTADGGAVRYIYLWPGNEMVSRVGTETGNGNQPSKRQNDPITYYHYDAIGSVCALTDKSGNTNQRYVYDPFGNILHQTGSEQNVYKFIGQFGVRNDVDTGLMLMGERYYDANTGRFISRDLAKDFENILNISLSLNRYLYCVNNPISYNDPSGYQPTTLQLLLIYGTEVIVGALIGGQVGVEITGQSPGTVEYYIVPPIPGAVFLRVEKDNQGKPHYRVFTMLDKNLMNEMSVRCGLIEGI